MGDTAAVPHKRLEWSGSARQSSVLPTCAIAVTVHALTIACSHPLQVQGLTEHLASVIGTKAQPARCLVLAIGDCLLDGAVAAGSMAKLVAECLGTANLAESVDYDTSCCFRGQQATSILLSLQAKHADMLQLCAAYTAVIVTIRMGTNDARYTLARDVEIQTKKVVAIGKDLIKGGGRVHCVGCYWG